MCTVYANVKVLEPSYVYIIVGIHSEPFRWIKRAASPCSWNQKMKSVTFVTCIVDKRKMISTFLLGLRLQLVYKDSILNIVLKIIWSSVALIEKCIFVIFKCLWNCQNVLGIYFKQKTEKSIFSLFFTKWRIETSLKIYFMIFQTVLHIHYNSSI